jgi:hypothetical protein
MTMAVDTTKIRAFQNGAVSVGAFGATPTLPTSYSASLTGFTEVGAITDDGITDTTSQDFNDIYMWQGNTLAVSLPGQNSLKFKFASMEMNLVTIGLNYPGSTITQITGGVTIAQKPPVRDLRSWVFHGIDGTKIQRVVVPSGQITERGDVVWSSADVTVWEYTVTCYVDASGNIAYRYIADASLGV